MPVIILKDGAPFIGDAQMSGAKIAELVADGVWTEADLARHGLQAAERFAAPEGKVKVGEPRYIEQGGRLVETFDVEDAPEPEPEPSLEERLLAALGMSREDARAALGELLK
jgi:hypothetical protein